MRSPESTYTIPPRYPSRCRAPPRGDPPAANWADAPAPTDSRQNCSTDSRAKVLWPPAVWLLRDSNVKMVGHQAIGMDLPTGLLTGFGERFQEVLKVHVIVEDVLPPIPTAHQVVNRPEIFNTHFARHMGSLFHFLTLSCLRGGPFLGQEGRHSVRAWASIPPIPLRLRRMEPRIALRFRRITGSMRWMGPQGRNGRSSRQAPRRPRPRRLGWTVPCRSHRGWLIRRLSFRGHASHPARIYDRV